MIKRNNVVAFGEIMLRLSPKDNGLICDARCFDACYGGSESNVLVCLSALGDNTQYLTALPATSTGDAAEKHLRALGVGTDHIVRQGETLGMYFLEEGFASRPSKVIYNRKHAEVTKLDPTAFNYDEIFADCDIFHICGISFALSESVCELCFHLLKEAKKRGIRTSFDFNYRAKLWSIESAAAVYRKIIPYIDILFCSERDLKTFLGTNINEFYTLYSVKNLIVREREILASGCHEAKASIYRCSKGAVECVATENAKFDVLERIGSGDAFVGGVLHSLLQAPDDAMSALRFGMACFVLKHTLKGDVFTLDSSAIKTYLNNISKDVSR